MHSIMNSFREFVQAIREINEKYKTPRIKMTRMVSFSLVLLRVYLIGMLVLLAYKFVVTVVVH
jgi:hypothetical protein